MFVCTIYDIEMIVRMALLHLRIYLVRRCLLFSILKRFISGWIYQIILKNVLGLRHIWLWMYILPSMLDNEWMISVR
jgi:hypothetical protein